MVSRPIRIWGAIVLVVVFGLVACEAAFPLNTDSQTNLNYDSTTYQIGIV